MAKVSNIRSVLLVKSIFAALYVFGILLNSTEACVSISTFQSSLYSRWARYTIECSQRIGDIFHLSYVLLIIYDVQDQCDSTDSS